MQAANKMAEKSFGKDKHAQSHRLRVRSVYV